MNKSVFACGLGLPAIFILGIILSDDEKSTEVSHLQVPAEIVSVSWLSDDEPTTAEGRRLAYLDPQTGQLTSEPADFEEGGTSLIPLGKLPPVKITAYANGAVRADLNGRFRTPLMATIACDGTLKTAHLEQPVQQDEKCEQVR